jgi:hypothetical protein
MHGLEHAAADVSKIDDDNIREFAESAQSLLKLQSQYIRLWGQTQNQILLVSIFGLRIQFGDQKCRLSVTFVNGLWRETWIVF